MTPKQLVSRQARCAHTLSITSLDAEASGMRKPAQWGQCSCQGWWSKIACDDSAEADTQIRAGHEAHRAQYHHLTELDCDPCAAAGVDPWFPTVEALEEHIEAEHPEECSHCLSHEAENRRDRRNGR